MSFEHANYNETTPINFLGSTGSKLRHCVKGDDAQPQKPLFEKSFDELNAVTNDQYIDREEFAKELSEGYEAGVLDKDIMAQFKDEAMALFDKHSGDDKKLDIREFDKMKKDLGKLEEKIQQAAVEQQKSNGLQELFDQLDYAPKDHYLDINEAFQYLKGLEGQISFKDFSKVRDGFEKEFNKLADKDGKVAIGEFKALFEKMMGIRQKQNVETTVQDQLAPKEDPLPGVGYDPSVTAADARASKAAAQDSGKMVADKLIGFTLNSSYDEISKTITQNINENNVTDFLRAYEDALKDKKESGKTIATAGGALTALEGVLGLVPDAVAASRLMADHFFTQMQSETGYDNANIDMKKVAMALAKHARNQGDIMNAGLIEALCQGEITADDAKMLDGIAKQIIK